MPLQVKAPTQPLRRYDRVVYVLDVSCSMSGKPLREAISVTDVFASDGFLSTVITFDHRMTQWGGANEDCNHEPEEEHSSRCLPEGWARFPKHRYQFRSHIKNLGAKGGGTEPGPALAEAVKTAPVGALIVFVSDGQFNKDKAVGALHMAMLARAAAKLAPVQILVWSTTKHETQKETLVEIAKIGGGGLWRADDRLTGPW